MIRRILLGLGAWAFTVSLAFAGQPVTIHNSANTQAACVDNNGNLCVTLNGSGGTSGATHTQTSALATSLPVKASKGTLYSFEVNADSTLSAAAWYIMIYDATSKPAAGAVTPAKCYGIPSGTTQAGGTFNSSGVAFTTGIVIAVSTAGCFTQTDSAHAFIAGDYQ